MCNFKLIYLPGVVGPALSEYCLMIFFHVEVDNLRVDQPALQGVKLVDLTVSKAAAILHGGCKHKSCCEALKKGTRVCLYSPSMKPHNFAQIRCVSNVCITLYEMNFNTCYWLL